jgi:hypothetical protein
MKNFIKAIKTYIGDCDFSNHKISFGLMLSGALLMISAIIFNFDPLAIAGVISIFIGFFSWLILGYYDMFYKDKETENEEIQNLIKLNKLLEKNNKEERFSIENGILVIKSKNMNISWSKGAINYYDELIEELNQQYLNLNESPLPFSYDSDYKLEITSNNKKNIINELNQVVVKLQEKYPQLSLKGNLTLFAICGNIEQPTPVLSEKSELVCIGHWISIFEPIINNNFLIQPLDKLFNIIDELIQNKNN